MAGDSLELLRGKCGRVFGQMTGLMMTLKGIPSTYNKDLQESVEPILEHVKTLKDSILIVGRVLSTLTTYPDKMLAALTPDMLATDLAEYLVRKGIHESFIYFLLYYCFSKIANPTTQASRFEKPTTSPDGSSHSQKIKTPQWINYHSKTSKA